MQKTLPVTAIEHGIVIDHIPAGQAVRIISLLGLADHRNKVTIGLNLHSKSYGLKDLIKMENRKLTEREQHEIAVFAPRASINVIENFKVVEKIQSTLPEAVMGLMVCPNPICISNQDPISSHFYLRHQKDHNVELQCHYCEKVFSRDEVKDATQ